MYPTAKQLRTHPCPCMSHLNSSVMGTIAMGMITLSAAFIKLAMEHSHSVCEGLFSMLYTWTLEGYTLLVRFKVIYHLGSQQPEIINNILIPLYAPAEFSLRGSRRLLAASTYFGYFNVYKCKTINRLKLSSGRLLKFLLKSLEGGVAFYKMEALFTA